MNTFNTDKTAVKKARNRKSALLGRYIDRAIEDLIATLKELEEAMIYAENTEELEQRHYEITICKDRLESKYSLNIKDYKQSNLHKSYDFDSDDDPF